MELLKDQVTAAPFDDHLRAGALWCIACLFFFTIVPVIFQKIVIKENLEKVGYSIRGFFKHLSPYLVLYLIMVPALYWASNQEAFARMYPLVPTAKDSMTSFLIWEAFYLTQFFALESFFRGYLLFTLSGRMEKWTAIAAAALPYTMIHFHKPFPETVGALFAGLVLGWLALRNKSWLGGAVLHSLVAITMDCLSAHLAGLF